MDWHEDSETDLTPPEFGIWLVSRTSPEPFNIHRVWALNGRLNKTALEAAVREVVSNHFAFRRRLVVFDGVPKWIEGSGEKAKSPQLWTFENDASADISEWMGCIGNYRFDFTNEQLFQARLLQTDYNRYYFSLLLHHLAGDGASLKILLEEVGVAYSRHAAGLPTSSRAERHAPVSAPSENSGYWSQQLSEAKWLEALPRTTGPRTDAAEVHRLRLSAEEVTLLRLASRQLRATPHLYGLAALYGALGIHGSPGDAMIATPFSGRTAELINAVGCFSRIVPLRHRWANGTSGAALVAGVKRLMTDTFIHTREPILEAATLFDASASGITISFQAHGSFPAPNLDGVHVSAIAEKHYGLTRFDLEMDLYLQEGSGSIVLTRRATGGITAAAGDALLADYKSVLLGIATEPTLPLPKLPAIVGTRSVLPMATESTCPPLVLERFEEIVKNAPNRMAIESGDNALTFAELDKAVSHLAVALRDNGAGLNTPVGIFAKRGIQLVVAILATWRVGAYLLLLDPLQPDSRIAHLLADVGATLTLCSSLYRTRLPQSQTVVELPAVPTIPPNIHDHAEVDKQNAGGALAYVIHTSGTTGKPKGVMIDQRNLAAYVDARVIAAEALRVGLTCAVSFDVFFLQLSHLFRGSCLVIPPDDIQRDPQALTAWAENKRVDFLSITPSLYSAMRDFEFDDVLARTGMMLELGGEAVDGETWKRMREINAAGGNCYGPTEVTVQASSCKFGDFAEPRIGRPLDSTSAYVLGSDLYPLPIGVSGELYIGGTQLSRGYLGNPLLTASKFLPDPFCATPGGRMYRTGDLVRLMEDGTLEYLGRTDHQLKVRGHRIEPAEVEHVLREIPGVRDAYVARGVRRGTGIQVYVLADEQGVALGGQRIREIASERLHSAAVPTRVSFVHRFPLTPGGKLDESALPVPVNEEPSTHDDALALMWSESLDGMSSVASDDFFSCGGSSLDAARLIAAVNRKFGTQVDLAGFFGDSTLVALREQVNLSAVNREPIAAGALGRDCLNPAQRRLWLLHKADPDSPQFTVYWGFEILGPLDTTAIVTAWRNLLLERPELRVRVIDGAVPTSAIWDVDTMHVRHYEVDEADIFAAIERATKHAFDLFGEPLLRLDLLRVEPERHIVLFVGNHLVVDRYSTQLLGARLLSLLNGGASDATRNISLAPQQVELSSSDYLILSDFWREELDGVSVSNPFAGGEQGEDPQRTPGKVSRTLSPRDWQRILSSCRTLRTTPLVLLMSALSAVADRYDASGDVLLGTTMDVRPPGYEDAIGLYVNPVPVRVRISPSFTGVDLVKAVHQAFFKSHAHRMLPFDSVVREAGLRSEGDGSPAFQLLVDYEPFERPPASPPGMAVKALEFEDHKAKYGMEISLRETEQGAVLEAHFGTSEWSQERADYILGLSRATFIQLTEENCGQDLVPVDLHEVITWGRGDPLAPSESVAEIVMGIALREPDKLAAVGTDGRITYGQLGSTALDISEELVDLGVRKGDIVAVLMERGTSFLPAFLGIHLAGAAYMPLDSEHPSRRLQSIIEDSGASVVVADNQSASMASDLGVPVLNAHGQMLQSTELPDVKARLQSRSPLSSGDLAYLIYTSGSTGRPKGVMVNHGALATSTTARRAVYAGRNVFLMVSPLVFDSSAAGIWGTLTSGGTLVIASTDDIRDPDRLLQLIQSHQVTQLLCVPSLYDTLLQFVGPNLGLQSLQEVILAGEPLPAKLMDMHFDILPNVALVNEYGPTEAAVWSSYRRFHEPAGIDIGRPVPGYRLYVLDSALRPVPQSAAGELYVGGPGVARGYLNRARETAGVFIPDPFSKSAGARMYRTGDKVRWNKDGSLAFIGRLDSQIKIRGHRIDPEEIRTVLMNSTGVSACAVVMGEDGRLTGFVTGSALEGGELRQQLTSHLPSYMCPAYIHVLDTIPLTSNGKTDYKQLEFRAISLNANYHQSGPPDTQDSLSLKVAAAWSAVLGMDEVPKNANFFDLGGHSLLVPKLQLELQNHTGMRLSVLELFKHSTVSDIVRHLSRDNDTVDAPTVENSSQRRSETARRQRSRRAQESQS